jgi:hypothetical protein
MDHMQHFFKQKDYCPVWFRFLLDFWRINAKSHPNSLRFIQRFMNAHFWPVRFALRHRLSKAPPYRRISKKSLRFLPLPLHP